MTNREALEIVLKLAEANSLDQNDIMYAAQVKQYDREQEALMRIKAVNSNNLIVEANSPHNDGYVKKGFQEKLLEMKKFPHQDNHMD